jgi:hypothetical protein
MNTKIMHAGEMKLLVEGMLKTRTVATNLTKFGQKSLKGDMKLPFKYSTKPKTIHDNLFITLIRIFFVFIIFQADSLFCR